MGLLVGVGERDFKRSDALLGEALSWRDLDNNAIKASASEDLRRLVGAKPLDDPPLDELVSFLTSLRQLTRMVVEPDRDQGMHFLRDTVKQYIDDKTRSLTEDDFIDGSQGIEPPFIVALRALVAKLALDVTARDRFVTVRELGR